MERSRGLLLVAGLLAALLPAAAAQPGAPCEPALLATQVALFCAPDMPTAQCCEPVVAAVDLGGGVPCLCRVAAEPQLVMAGLNATHLLTLYSSCGGLRPGGAHLAAACEGPAPPAAVVSSPPPPPPPSAAPRHDAPPPPPPSSEKPSSPPPSQDHDGAAPRAKAAPAQAATSTLAPAAAATAPPPQAPHSAAPTAPSKAAFFFVATAMLGLYIIL
ncbi:hypothetical protein CFC21_056119 [Triticum aestivum]|uniref:Bifunctional inhibitor/plant lipid transfer protein/seed storage helical domain-containing protein n=2 Tax=Triticum aestivum TaxID=4565 RepID=A0A3B6IKJ6_WHEAT|nr:hypothetical protein CFC21_056119 [Triticum aestivum]